MEIRQTSTSTISALVSAPIFDILRKRIQSIIRVLRMSSLSKNEPTTELNKMKTDDAIKTWIVPVLSLCVIATGAFAQDKNPVAKNPVFVESPEYGIETHRDLPGSFHRYYGQRINSWRDGERRIAKLDLDGDMNYDGAIDNSDPADNGAFEQTPPGLVLGEGELTKFILRLRPYRVDYAGEVVVTVEVAGINRGDRSGEFGSIDEELSSTGRIRVWSNAAKTELLLDSGDINKRYHEWIMDQTVYPANLPEVVPRTFYVEGVDASPRYMGDVRLLVTVSHRKRGASRGEPFIYDGKSVVSDKSVVTENTATGPITGPRFLKRYRTDFDHCLLTVRSKPMVKEFINDNAEGVWK